MFLWSPGQASIRLLSGMIAWSGAKGEIVLSGSLVQSALDIQFLHVIGNCLPTGKCATSSVYNFQDFRFYS